MIAAALSLLLVLVSAPSLVLGDGSVGASARPYYNVALIELDDVGRCDLDWDGPCRGTATPNIDRLRDEGVRLDTFWVATVCGPGRANLLTGRFEHRHGVVGAGGSTFRAAAEVTIPKALELGRPGLYRTGAFGKLGLGGADVADPNEPPGVMGWDRFRGRYNSQDQFSEPHHGEYSRLELERNSSLDPGDWTIAYEALHAGQIDAESTADAIAYIAEIAAEQRPLFFWFSPLAAHNRQEPVPPSVCAIGSEACYEERIEWIDGRIGELLAVLDPASWLVIFTTDNGGVFDAPGEGKGTSRESAINMPFAAWGGPIQNAPRTVAGVFSLVDLLPTLRDLSRSRARQTNHPIVPGDPYYDGGPRYEDGESLLPALLDLGGPYGHDYLLGLNGSRYMVRHQPGAFGAGDYKLLGSVISPGSEELYQLPDESADLCAGDCGALGGDAAAAFAAMRAHAAAAYAEEGLVLP